MIKEDNDDFKNSSKYWNNDVKVRDHCHILGNYNSHLILQELGKFNLKINVIRNELEKYMSFIINCK